MSEWNGRYLHNYRGAPVCALWACGWASLDFTCRLSPFLGGVGARSGSALSVGLDGGHRSRQLGEKIFLVRVLHKQGRTSPLPFAGPVISTSPVSSHWILNSLRKQILFFPFLQRRKLQLKSPSHLPKLLMDPGVFYHNGLPSIFKSLVFLKKTWLISILVRAEVMK